MAENRIDQALSELTRLGSIDESLAVLKALDQKRRERYFIKYWQPYQKQGEALVQFTGDLKVFGLLGGNRSGKTELGVFVVLAFALGRDFFKGEPAWEFVKDLPIPDKPCNIWIVGLDFSMLRDVIWREKIRQGREHPALLPKDDLLVTKVSDSDFQIFFANGSVITGKSADSGREKFQGASVDLIWIDEEPEADIYDECYQRTVDCRGKILLTLTPLSDINSGVRTPWVFDLFEDWKAGSAKDVKFVQLSVLDNPYVPDEEKDKLKIKWAGHFEEKARLYGEFVRRSGLVYNLWDPAKHMIAPQPLPRDWQRVVSIDPANTGTTAVVWAAVDPNGNLYIYREYYAANKTVVDHVKDILIKNAGDLIDIWLIDPKWGSQRTAESHKQNIQLYRDAGLPVRLAPVNNDYGLNLSREYVQATIEPLSRHPKVRVFRDLENFKYEIEHYTWAFFERGENKGQSKDKPIKRNDHLMNAFQYLCCLRPRGRGRVVETPESRRLDARDNSYTDPINIGPVSADKRFWG